MIDEVKNMSISDVVWELTELTSNERLLDVVYKLVKDTWRKLNPHNDLDCLLDELLNNDSLQAYIVYLGLEEKIKTMLSERMIERLE